MLSQRLHMWASLEEIRTRSQENLASSCTIFLEAEAPLINGRSDKAKFSWTCRETSPPSTRKKIAKKYATNTRLEGAKEVNSNIWYCTDSRQQSSCKTQRPVISD